MEETLGLLGLVFEEPDPSVFDPQCEKNLSFARLSEPGGCRVVLLEIQSGVLKVADGANGRAFNSLQLILGNEAEAVYFCSDGEIDPKFEYWGKALWKDKFQRIGFLDHGKIELIRGTKRPAARANMLKAFLSLENAGLAGPPEDVAADAAAAPDDGPAAEAAAPPPEPPAAEPPPVTFEEPPTAEITDDSFPRAHSLVRSWRRPWSSAPQGCRRCSERIESPV